MDMLDNPEVPQWLSSLLSEKFFNACIIHEDAKKNEKNVFCLDCCEGICPHCLRHHRSHRLLQVRRYVYHDVIRLVNAEELIDCARVQSYTTNSAKVIFLKQRPQTRAHRAVGKSCITCERRIQETFLFCSLSCKLQHVLGSGSKLSSYLRKCDFMALPDPSSDDGQLTPDSVFEPDGSTRTESGSSSGALTGLIDCPILTCGALTGLIDCPILTCTATTEIVRKKRSNLSVSRTGFGQGCKPDPGFSYAMVNRRKGTPQRSPLI